MIYLDNAATTFPKPIEVYDYVDWVQRNIAVNIGRGSYKIACEAMDIVEEAKKRMATFLHVESEDAVIFTPSATVAANEIVWGLEWDHFKNVYVSPFEHNAIMRPLEQIRKQYGINIIQLPFDGKTQELDIDEMERLFNANIPDYVFVNQVSNVTGVILPVGVIGRVAKKYDAIMIVDGSQSIGLLNIDLRNEPIDFLIFAGHKNLYSSWGIGGFLRNTRYELKKILMGGTGSDSLNLDVNSFEVGSPNIIAIASLNKSLEWLVAKGIKEIAEHKELLVRQLIDGIYGAKAKLYLPKNLANHTSIVSFNILGYEPSEVGMILDQDFDIAVRTGFHCAPFVHKLIDTESVKGTVRVSVSCFNTEQDIRKLIDAIKDI